MSIELQTNLALIPEPAAPDHVVNVKWVTAFFAGLRKAPVRLVATTNQSGTYANLEFTFGAQGPVDIDGETVDQGDRILFTAQSDPTENLIFECTHVGTAGTDETIFTVADDFNEDHKIQTGISVAVTDGDDQAGSSWHLTTAGTIVLGTTALDWERHVVPRTTEVHAEDFDGDGTTTEFEIDHNLGTSDVSVTVYNRANNALVLTDVETTDSNTVTIGFAVAPATGHNYRAVVIG